MRTHDEIKTMVVTAGVLSPQYGEAATVVFPFLAFSTFLISFTFRTGGMIWRLMVKNDDVGKRYIFWVAMTKISLAVNFSPPNSHWLGCMGVLKRINIFSCILLN
jgi:hypothetical protein